MPEEGQKQEPEPEGSPAPEPVKKAGKKAPLESAGLVEKANDAATRLENANIELGKLLEKQAALQVESTLGGTATAGQPEPTEEQKSTAEAKKLLDGTGFEDLFDEPAPKK